MKIAITGKGGVGKTTLSALIARAWMDKGFKVLAIDVDPVASLAGALGFPNPDKIMSLSQMVELIEERTGAKPGKSGQIFKLNPTVSDLPDKIATVHNGVKLIVMGGVASGGSGCVCPENTLIRSLLQHIILNRDERVVVDMEAGIEHLGRSTADSVDCLITVVEPSGRSIRAAHQIKSLAKDIGIKNIRVVGNKIQSPDDEKFILNNLDSLGIIGMIPVSVSIKEMDTKGYRDMTDHKVISAIDLILTALERKDNA
ncbi:MAG: AAA family ATPase [Candidatus Brocadiia bacterium]